MINLLKDIKKRGCTACRFLAAGVKTRKNIPHTCGKSTEQIYENNKKRKDKELGS